MPTSAWCIFSLLLLINQGFSLQNQNISPNKVQPCAVNVKTKAENNPYKGGKTNKPYYLFFSEDLNEKGKLNTEKQANSVLKLPRISSNNVKSRLFGNSLSPKQNQRRLGWGKLGFDLYDLMGNSMNIAHTVARKSQSDKDLNEVKEDNIPMNDATSEVEDKVVSKEDVEETNDKSSRKRRSTLYPLLNDDIYHLWYGSHGPPFSLRNSILARLEESLAQLKPVPSKRGYQFQRRGGFLRQSIIPTFGRYSMGRVGGQGMMSTNMGRNNMGHLSIDLDLQALNDMLRHRALRRNIHSIMHRLKMRLGNSRAHLTRAG